MSESEPGQAAGVAVRPSDGMLQRIQVLRDGGAERFDPVGFRFIEILSERTQSHEGRARSLLDVRLAKAVAAFETRLAQTHDAAKDAITAPSPALPDSALRVLVRRMEAHTPAGADVRPGDAVASRPELKSVRYFRKTWAQLSADKQVAQALNQAPRNAGPINSHMVVLRSLALMRDTAPDYLNRFMSYVDTLLCLEQGGAAAPLPAKTPRSRSR